MIGSVIDKYEVLQKLGEGATATVYRGRHLSIGKDVAIKVLHPHLSASTRYRERFNREARAVGRLTHENIVSILDYSGQGTEDCYIVTELVDGCTLLQLIEEHGRIPSEVVAALGMELSGALGFAHRAGISHRDITPENVMVRRDGVVKLMDFGVARVIDEGQITLDGSLLGSPAYMSPQQALDEKLDGRSDLFSLGTVLFHSVTGTVPFSGTNASIILRNIIDGLRPDVLELDPRAAPGLVAVIDKLLQTRADDRYADAEEVKAALAGALAESGLGADHPRINLRAWLLNPREVGAALEEHLRTDLLARGKTRLAAGDTVGALQLFNRLLAIDEEHAEVLSLIGALHAPPPRQAPRGLLGAIGGIALLAAGLGAWALVPRQNPPPVVEPAPVVAEVPKPSPAPAVLAATPAPAPEAPPSKPTSPPRASATLPATGVRPAALVVAATPAPLPAAVATPATVIFKWSGRARSVSVRVDGAPVGVFRTGPAVGWIGTRQRPIELTAGRHTIELINEKMEPWSTTLTVAAGEERTVVVPELKGLPADYVVNSRMPDDCQMSIGDTKYGELPKFGRQFNRPASGTESVTFDCGARGVHTFALPPLQAGGQAPVPVSLPPELQ